MDQLRTLARLRILQGELPSAPTMMPDGTKSGGECCGLCEQAIESGSPMIIIRWHSNDQERGATLHPLCHALWLGFVSDTRRTAQQGKVQPSEPRTGGELLPPFER
jgi:hypothetical protein